MNFNVRQKKVINATEPNIVCLAGAGCGKCIPNSTNIPTPDGWRKVEEIKIGDYLFDRQGNPTKVLGVYPQGKKEVYEITFGDGRQAKCSIDHIWSYYKIPNGKRLYSKTLEEILLENSNKLNKYKNKAGKYCYQIPLIEKVKYPKREYSIPPYILGLFLGDGSFREKAIMFSSEDDFLPKKIAAIMNWDYYRHKANKYCWYFKHKEVQKNEGYEFYKVKTSEFLKVYPELVNKKSEEKFIPEDYLMGSVEQRIELLRGLLDTDGCIGERGDIRYTTISEKLCKDMLSLIYSLGFKGGYYIENKGENKNKAYHISIQCNNQEKPRLFSVPKKYQRAIKISNKRNSHYSNTNPIIDIKRLNYEEEMTCFYVDNKEHLFAINDWCITHNTSVLTERISHLITENNVDPKKIVAISFTTMAAEEMKKRLGDIAEGAFIGTIHSYANAICIANGISTEKYVADAEFDKIIEKVLTIPIKRYFPVTHLLVDEFQDTGSLEYRFIERIPTENRFYIGDERQAIYGFKGCSDEFLRMCHADISFTTYYLNQNYRCAPNILAYADSYLNTMEKISLKSEAVKTKNGIVEEDSTLLDAIEELEWAGDYQNWAVICRTNNELAAAVDFLDKRKIPNLSFKKGDLDLVEMEGLLRENKVKVLTIHTAKGLEFKKVIVIGAKTFNEEERKISYVAATRAEQALYCCPSICKRGKKGRPQNRDVAEAGKIIQQMAKNNIVF